MRPTYRRDRRRVVVWIDDHPQAEFLAADDFVQLQRQLGKHGTSIKGMPPPEVKRGSDGELVIFDGVTRATRVAKYLPGTPITVEVSGQLKGPVGALPTVGEKV